LHNGQERGSQGGLESSKKETSNEDTLELVGERSADDDDTPGCDNDGFCLSNHEHLGLVADNGTGSLTKHVEAQPFLDRVLDQHIGTKRLNDQLSDVDDGS
jgi:hypothetical protein